MAKSALQIIIGSTRPGRVGSAVADWIIDREKIDEDRRPKPNEIMEQAATVMLDELARWAEALRPLRSG